MNPPKITLSHPASRPLRARLFASARSATLASVMLAAFGCVVAPLEGETAPNFTFTDQFGDELELYQLYGHVVVVKLYTAWCGPCQTSAPHGEELWLDHEDEGLEFVSVMLEDVNHAVPDAADIAAWVDAFDITHPVVADQHPATWAPVAGFPTYAIIDRDMTVVHYGYGLNDSVVLDLLSTP